MRLIIWGAAAVLCVFTGCASNASEGDQADSTAVADTVETEAEEPESYDYAVYLNGALTDTLQGDARFGKVMKAGTQHISTLIELQTGSDFTGGFFVALSDTVLPAPGSFSLDRPEQEEGTGQPAQPQAVPYEIVFRRGLLVNLVSTAGTLTLTTVTDTLITGSFEANLVGEVRTTERITDQGEVSARGEFRATPGGVGFVIGL